MKLTLRRLSLSVSAVLVASLLPGLTASSGAASIVAAEPGVPELLSPAPAGAARAAVLPAPSEAVRSRLTGFDARALPAKAAGQRVALTFFDNARFVARIDATNSSSLGTFWRGQVVGDRNSAFVAVQVGDTFRSGVLSAKGTFSLEKASATQGVYRAAEVTRPDVNENDGLSVADVPALEKGAATATDRPTPSSVRGVGAQERSLRQAAEKPRVVTQFSARRDPKTSLDIGIVFSPQAVAYRGGSIDQANADALYAVALNNQVYANSGIGVQWRLVGTRVGPSEKSQYHQTLRALSKEKKKFRKIKKWRNRVHADVVHMLTGPDQDWCGLAWLDVNDSRKYYWKRPYSIAGINCIDILATTHEVGHNYGASHDPYALNTCKNCGTKAYAYGQGLVYVPGGWYTAMSYPNQCIAAGVYCSVLPVFSNPKLAYNGVPVGTKSQNNVRVHNKTRKRMARFKQGAIYPAKVKLKGKPKAKKYVRVVTKRKKWTPGKVKLKFRWYVNGAPVQGKKGKKTRLKLKKAWKGMPVFCLVKGKKKHYSPVLVQTRTKIVR